MIPSKPRQNGMRTGVREGEGEGKGMKWRGKEGVERRCHGPDQVWEEIDANDLITKMLLAGLLFNIAETFWMFSDDIYNAFRSK